METKSASVKRGWQPEAGWGVPVAWLTLCIVWSSTWLAIKIVFGFAGSLIGLLLSLAFFALKVALVVGLVYWLLTVFSPETARKMRDALRGESL